MPQAFLIQQLSPSVLPGSKEHTANLQGIFLDLTGEVQWSLSNLDPAKSRGHGHHAMNVWLN